MIIEGISVVFAADVASLLAGVQSVVDSVSSVSDSAASVSGLSDAFDLASESATSAVSGIEEMASAVAGVGDESASLSSLNDDIASVGTAATETADQMDASLSDVVGAIDNLSSNFADLSANIQEQMASASDSVETMANTAQESSGLFGGGMIGMVNKAGMFAMSLNANVQMVEQFGGALLSGNASMEQTDVAFKQLLGSSSAANAELQDLQQFAAATPFDFPELAKDTQELLAFQIPLKQTKPLLTAIGDAISGLGGSSAQVEQVVQVFGQMNAAGKIQTQDLMQLTSVGINGFQLLASNIHLSKDEVNELVKSGIAPAKDAHALLAGSIQLTVAQLKDMVTKGLIPASQGIQTLQNGMEKTFGGGMQAQSQTFNGLMSTLQDNISSAWRAFTGPLFDAAKSRMVTLGNLVSSPQFAAFAQTMGKDVSGAMGAVGSAVGQVIQVFKMFGDGWAELAGSVDTGGMAASFRGLHQTMSSLGSTVGPLIIPLFNNLNNLFINVAGYLSGLVSPALQIASQVMAGMGTVMPPIIMGADQLMLAIQSLVGAIAPLLIGIVQWVADSGIVPVIFNAIGGAISFVIPIIAGIISGIASLISFFSQNQVAGDLLIGIIAGLAAGFIAFQVAAIAPLIVGIGVMVAMAIPSLIAGFIAWAVAAGAAAIATLIAAAPFILIGAVIALVVAGIILAIQHWGAITSWLSGVWSAFSAWFMGALSAVGNFFVGVWQHIVAGLQAAWNMIVNIVKIALLVLLVIIFAPIIAIAALFIWLYQHNTYFKMLVDAIINFVKAGVAWLVDAWHNTINWIVSAWQFLVTAATMYFMMVYVTISAKVQQVVGFLHGIWTSVIGFLSGIWATIATNVSAMWSKISGFFSSAWSTYISGPLQSLWSSITGFVSGWAGQAVQWGVNLIQGFINGITSMIGNVGSAVGNIASKIAANLGFHSPTKEGPGRELDVWAPNMVKEFAQGLDEGVPLIQAAVTHLIQPTSALGAYPGGSNTPSSSLQGNGGGGQSKVEHHFHIYLDSQELAPTIGEHIVRSVRIATGSKAA